MDPVGDVPFCSVCEHRLLEATGSKQQKILAVPSFQLNINRETNTAHVSRDASPNASTYELYTELFFDPRQQFIEDGNITTDKTEVTFHFTDFDSQPWSYNIRLRARSDEGTSIFNHLALSTNKDRGAEIPQRLDKPDQLKAEIYDNRSLKLTWRSAEQYTGSNAKDVWSRDAFGLNSQRVPSAADPKSFKTCL